MLFSFFVKLQQHKADQGNYCLALVDWVLFKELATDLNECATVVTDFIR